MDLRQLPPPDDGAKPTATRVPAQPASSPPRAVAVTAAVSEPSFDRLNIQPLDLVSALRIMIAEVRAELPMPGDATQAESTTPLDAPVPGAAAVPQALVQYLLQSLPDDAPDVPWLAAADLGEAQLQRALDQGLYTVSAWHDVPQAVVDAAKDVRAVVIAQLNDDPPSPLWLLPEWSSLLSRMERFWRRRRHTRRGLTDPDWRPGTRRDETLDNRSGER